MPRPSTPIAPARTAVRRLNRGCSGRLGSTIDRFRKFTARPRLSVGFSSIGLFNRS